MKKNIKEHYRDEDVQKFNLNSDIDNWKAEIEFAEKEITFFKSLLKSLPNTNTEKIQKNTDKLLRQLEQSHHDNQSFSEALLHFENHSEGINECDDLQCETYFLNNHEDFRNKIEEYTLQFRVLKEVIFSHLEKNTHQ